MNTSIETPTKIVVARANDFSVVEPAEWNNTWDGVPQYFNANRPIQLLDLSHGVNCDHPIDRTYLIAEGGVLENIIIKIEYFSPEGTITEFFKLDVSTHHASLFVTSQDTSNRGNRVIRPTNTSFINRYTTQWDGSQSKIASLMNENKLKIECIVRGELNIWTGTLNVSGTTHLYFLSHENNNPVNPSDIHLDSRMIGSLEAYSVDLYFDKE